jgi:aspartate/glutamate racemase
MSRTIGLIHATVAAVEPMRTLFASRLPQVTALNFLDEGLLKQLNEVGSITPKITYRMANLVLMAQTAGAELALLTCSAFASTVDTVQNLVEIPVYKIDEMLIDAAVERGSRIGMIATVSGTYRFTQERIYQRAHKVGKTVSVQAVLLEPAFEALLSGRPQLHDQLIAASAHDLSQTCDVIVLAQVSMARALDLIEPEAKIPVLTSPLLAIECVKQALEL